MLGFAANGRISRAICRRIRKSRPEQFQVVRVQAQAFAGVASKETDYRGPAGALLFDDLGHPPGVGLG